MRTHYEILGVDEHASQEQLRAAWRVRVQLLHPDVHHGARPEVIAVAEEELRQVNEAWEVLGNVETRWAYDQRLRAESYVATPVPRSGATAVDPRPPSQRELRRSARRALRARGSRTRLLGALAIAAATMQSAAMFAPGPVGIRSHAGDMRSFWFNGIQIAVVAVIGVGLVLRRPTASSMWVGALIGATIGQLDWYVRAVVDAGYGEIEMTRWFWLDVGSWALLAFATLVGIIQLRGIQWPATPQGLLDVVPLLVAALPVAATLLEGWQDLWADTAFIYRLLALLELIGVAAVAAALSSVEVQGFGLSVWTGWAATRLSWIVVYLFVERDDLVAIERTPRFDLAALATALTLVVGVAMGALVRRSGKRSR